MLRPSRAEQMAPNSLSVIDTSPEIIPALKSSMVDCVASTTSLATMTGLSFSTTAVQVFAIDIRSSKLKTTAVSANPSSLVKNRCT